ncbi:unnamed protein product [Paramecium pentaurelia]|uniref:Uncharacterized protein n=1 Tax=Paramecium pentaurelia TaxID=43138 RepID=A0A8S1UV25_9CILI|nr:unnamed protein product [Paramecium pentaurelia]
MLISLLKKEKELCKSQNIVNPSLDHQIIKRSKSQLYDQNKSQFMGQLRNIWDYSQILSKTHNYQTSNYITTLLISKKAIFQAKGALILKGDFINQFGIDLKTLFKQKGSCFLEDLQKK